MMKFPKLQFKFFTTLFFILFLFSFQLWGRSKLDTGLINTDKAIPSVLTSYLNSAGAVSNKFVNVSEVLFQSSLTLTSSSSGNVFCIGETVQITATALASVTTYNFLVNGEFQQNTASSTFTFTPVGTGNVTVTVIASLQNNSTLQDSIFLIQNAVQAGSIAGAAYICKGTIPNTLTSISPAIINGTAVSNTATTVYQWQSSLDGITWNDILNANSETYSPQAQNATINFRRKALNLLNGKLCSDVSNIVKITVLPDLLGGNID